MTASQPNLRRTLAALLLLLCLNVAAFAQTADDAATAKAIDKLVSKAYPADGPGASVIVIKEGRTLLRKGYGMADVELGVKVEPDMVFRLGSITKQFTAVAILMLAEQGKLSLADDVTKFFPDYPSKGRVVTVEHLLTHTSGIKSYTSMPAWRSMWRKDMTVAELIDLFKNEPADFEPGAQWSYNNSGYILLGAIIEKVSGVTYEQFLQKNVFDPLGMKHTFYGSAARVIPRRVPGYTMSKEVLRNAEYLSMTQPYAAGSLLSNVDDLAIWDAALYTDKLVKQASLQKAWTPYVLKDGTTTNYGFGWSKLRYEGLTLVEHTGGIHGFSTIGIRAPEERVYVAILTNRDYQTPDSLGLRVAALAMGRPMRDAVAAAVAPAELDALAGVYQISDKENYAVRRAGARVMIQRGGGRINEVFPLSPNEFFYDKASPDRLTFTRDASGKVTGLRVTRRFGPPTVAARTDKTPPRGAAGGPVVSLALAPEVLERYVGVYELTPNLLLTVVLRDGSLFAQATGKPESQLFADSDTTFFLVGVDARVEFQTGADGKATGLILHQDGRDTSAKKVK
ncbi:MAG TPA: serine hydrolase [Pyrinomonadaceae bacterium]|jgi:CubicO group peptidase (beta-lactamase class C family)|nr:serine hydrolase [Pyrinomonadaceae bacterium]